MKRTVKVHEVGADSHYEITLIDDPGWSGWYVPRDALLVLDVYAPLRVRAGDCLTLGESGEVLVNGAGWELRDQAFADVAPTFSIIGAREQVAGDFYAYFRGQRLPVREGDKLSIRRGSDGELFLCLESSAPAQNEALREVEGIGRQVLASFPEIKKYLYLDAHERAASIVDGIAVARRGLAAVAAYGDEPVRWECHRCQYFCDTTKPPKTCPSCGHKAECDPRCDKRPYDGMTTQPIPWYGRRP